MNCVVGDDEDERRVHSNDNLMMHDVSLKEVEKRIVQPAEMYVVDSAEPLQIL